MLLSILDYCGLIEAGLAKTRHSSDHAAEISLLAKIWLPLRVCIDLCTLHVKRPERIKLGGLRRYPIRFFSSLFILVHLLVFKPWFLVVEANEIYSAIQSSGSYCLVVGLDSRHCYPLMFAS